MKPNGKVITIPIAIILFSISLFVGYGRVQQKIEGCSEKIVAVEEEAKEHIEKVEEEVEKLEDNHNEDIKKIGETFSGIKDMFAEQMICIGKMQKDVEYMREDIKEIKENNE